jgi:hypothetical protein
VRSSRTEPVGPRPGECFQGADSNLSKEKAGRKERKRYVRMHWVFLSHPGTNTCNRARNEGIRARKKKPTGKEVNLIIRQTIRNAEPLAHPPVGNVEGKICHITPALAS